jgi:flagellin
MAMTINTNVSSLNAQRQLSKTQTALSTAMERLSSGLRVNSAKDDAAGLAISVKMQAQIGGNTVAIRNANDGISLAQTADGALSSMSDMLQRMRDLAVESANATNSSDNAELDQEYQALGKEITRVITSTKFNGIAVLSGGAASLDFQIGADNSADNVINIAVTDLSASTAITDVTGGAITDATTSKKAMTDIDTALSTINTAPRRWAPRRTVSSTLCPTSKSPIQTCLPPRAASRMQTSRRKPLTCPRHLSCSRLAPRCWRRPTRRLSRF